MSVRRLSEMLAAVGVIGSLVFVGQEIRQSNIQARAAAYQEIGIATAEFHIAPGEALLGQFVEAGSPEAIARWSAADWERYNRWQTAGMRLLETLLLQVEQGLLPATAVDRLGYSFLRTGWLAVPAHACLWPQLSEAVSHGVREFVESVPDAERHVCEVDLDQLKIEWVTDGG